MLLDLLKIFRSNKTTSKDVAKERLQVILVHDRGADEKFIEMLKCEIFKVMSNYVEIDEDALEIQMTRIKNEEGDRLVPALVANIPIRNVKKSGK